MLRKLFVRAQEDENVLSSSFASSAAMSLIEDCHPMILAREKGEDVSPFTPTLCPHPDLSMHLPGALGAQWESLYTSLTADKSSIRGGTDTVCYFRLPERLAFFHSVGDMLEEIETVSPAFAQVLLVTLKDVMNVCREVLEKMEKSDKELDSADTLPKHASDLEALFLLLQHCVLHDRSRFLLSSDALSVLFSFYAALTAALPHTPADLRSADYMKLFYCATQAVYAVGELLVVHESQGQLYADMRTKAVKLIKDAIFVAAADEKVAALAETQFAFFTSNRSLKLSFHPKSVPYIDLSLVLLVNLYNLSKSLPTLWEFAQDLIRCELIGISQSLIRHKTTEDHLPEVCCLYDKFLVILHFLKSLLRQFKSVGLRSFADNYSRLREVMMNCCWFFVKWECPLYGESFRCDEGRLGKLYLSLLQVFEGLVGTPEERAPLGFFAGLPEWIETDYTQVCEDRPGVLQTYTLELVSEYLQLFPSSKAYRIVLDSSLLTVLLTPFFQLVPTTLQHSPFDVAELPTTTNLAQHCSSYLTQTLKILLKHKEGKLLFLQEFTKGFQQYRDNIAYITKLGRLMSEMVSNEEREWVDLLAEMHLVDYIFQVVIDSKKLIETPEAMKPLQVTITNMLKIPQLAANLLQQKIIVKRTEELFHSAESAEFCMEVMARLLACNASQKLYKRFAHLLKKEKSESVVKLLFQSVEVALSAKGEEKATSQRLFVENSVLSIALRRFEEFQSLDFSSVALPCIRCLLHSSESAHRELRQIGFSGLSHTLLSVMDSYRGSIADGRDLENLIDNLVFILFDTTDIATSALSIAIPEVAEVVMQVVVRSGDEALQNRYFELFCEVAAKSQENALVLSQYGAMRPVLRFFTVTQNRELRLKCLTLISALSKQHFAPGDLLQLLSLINDDTKASYPSSISSDLLLVIRDAFEGGETKAYFAFRSGASIVCNVNIAIRNGFTVVIWLQTASTGNHQSLLTFTNHDSSKTLRAVVLSTGELSVTYSHKGNTVLQCVFASADLTAFRMLTVSYQPKTGLKQKSDISASVDNSPLPAVLIDGKVKLDEDGFDSFSIGTGEGFTGAVGSVYLFQSALSPQALEEIYTAGPLCCVSLVTECLYSDYAVSHMPLKAQRVRELNTELALALNPLYTYDSAHAINAVHRLFASKWSDSGAGSPTRGDGEKSLYPVLSRVSVLRRTPVSESLGAIGGLKLLLPLLTRIDKQSHLKEILHPVLEVAALFCRARGAARWIVGDSLFFPTLTLQLQQLSRRLSFKTSTAILVNAVKDSLQWNSALQMSAVECLTLNPRIWDRSKRAIQTMLVSVNHCGLYVGKARVRLVARLVEFCLCVSDLPLSPTGQRDAARSNFLRKVAELVKSYTLDSEDLVQMILRELVRATVDYEPQHVSIVHLLLKILRFFAKRGSVQPRGSLLRVLLYLLHKDADGSRNYTRPVLHILKMTVFDVSNLPDSKRTACDLPTLVAYINKYMKTRLVPGDYHAVLSLMVRVPDLTQKQVAGRYPDLPYKAGYRQLVANFRDVLVRVPQVLDVITSRLAFGAENEVVEDVVLLAERHIDVLFAQDSFPEWLLTLWRHHDSSPPERQRLTQSLTVTVLCHGLQRAESPTDKLRRLVLFLSNETKRLAPLLPEVLVRAMEMMLMFPDAVEGSSLCRTNLLHFAYLYEDAVTALKAAKVDTDAALTIRFVDLMKLARLLHHTKPEIPVVTLDEFLAAKDESRQKPEFRDGGVSRIALKAVFLHLRTAPAGDLFSLFPLLRRVVPPVLQMRKNSVSAVNGDKGRGRKAAGDLLTDSLFISTLLLAELTELMSARRTEEAVVSIVSEAIISLHETYGFSSAVEAAAQRLSLEEFSAVRRCLSQSSSASLGTLSPPYRQSRAVVPSIWDSDIYEVVCQKLQAQSTALKFALSSQQALEQFLLSSAWLDSFHPYFLLSSSFLLAVSAKGLQPAMAASGSKGRSVSSVDQMMESVLSKVEKIMQKRFRLRHDALLDSQYHKLQWKAYLKWQSREAGLWAKLAPANLVWKVDPEFDLELKCPRLKQMYDRCQSYYDDKAHKKTLALLSSDVKEERRPSKDNLETITPRRRNCATVAIDAEEAREFADLLLTKSPSAPHPDTPITPVRDFSESAFILSDYEDTYECERIQAKGATFGSLKVSRKYLVFDSARQGKGSNARYFGGALVTSNQSWNEITRKKRIMLRLSDISEVFERRFNQQYTAVEVFTHFGRGYFFNLFESGSVEGLRKALERARFAGKVYGNLSRAFAAERFTADWKEGKLSNFEYLMTVNRFASRSFNDINQYPVFPWVVDDYESAELNLNNPASFRDLAKPIGAILPEAREEAERRYRQFSSDPDMHPHHFGSHYSMSGSVVYFMLRLEPFTSQAILLQDGQFDVADRVFSSIPIAYLSSTRNSGDYKELIPEMFYLSEVLTNPNRLPLGRCQADRPVSSVSLPIWANNSPYRFTRLHRAALESARVSEKLSSWVDLIFGFAQTGEQARLACNVFLDSTYEEHAKRMIEAAKRDPRASGLIDQILLYGQTPVQLFTARHQKKSSEKEQLQNIFALLKTMESPLKASFIGQISDFPLRAIGVFSYRSGVVIVTEDRKMTWQRPKQPCEKYKESEFKYPEGVLPDRSQWTRSHFRLFQSTYIVTANYADNSFKVHNFDRFRLAASVAFHVAMTTCLSVDGEVLLVGSRDSTLSLWKFPVDSEGRLVTSCAVVHHLRTSQSGVVQCAVRWVLQAAVALCAVRTRQNGALVLFSLRTALAVRKLDSFVDPPALMDMSKSGLIALYFAGDQKRVALVSMNGFSVRSLPPPLETHKLHTLEFAQMSDSLLLASEDGLCLFSALQEFDTAKFPVAKDGKARLDAVSLVPTDQGVLRLTVDLVTTRTNERLTLATVDEVHAPTQVSEFLVKRGFPA